MVWHTVHDLCPSQLIRIDLKLARICFYGCCHYLCCFFFCSLSANRLILRLMMCTDTLAAFSVCCCVCSVHWCANFNLSMKNQCMGNFFYFLPLVSRSRDSNIVLTLVTGRSHKLKETQLFFDGSIVNGSFKHFIVILFHRSNEEICPSNHSNCIS